MKNMVVLELVDGQIHCRQLTEEGVELVKECGKDSTMRSPYWEEGGSILLEELMEILNKDR